MRGGRAVSGLKDPIDCTVWPRPRAVGRRMGWAGTWGFVWNCSRWWERGSQGDQRNAFPTLWCVMYESGLAQGPRPGSSGVAGLAVGLG